MTTTDKNVNKRVVTPARIRRTASDARENILAAAETMLTASGPQTLKLAEVARAAGVSNATVLHHFGAIDEVQAALMERMVRHLVDRVLAISLDSADPAASAWEGVTALFDAFEAKGAARLAAWLELTGEARRLTMIRTAIRDVIARRTAAYPEFPAALMENYMLVSITLALGVGLFGPTLSELLDRPARTARDSALAMLHAVLQTAWQAAART